VPRVLLGCQDDSDVARAALGQHPHARKGKPCDVHTHNDIKLCERCLCKAALRIHVNQIYALLAASGWADISAPALPVSGFR
jgi:hypothetical protein